MASAATHYHPSEVSPPGETILELLEERGISQADFATRMDRPAKTINDLIHGKQRLTPETALQLESTLSVPAAFWLAREANYQEWLARSSRQESLGQDAAWLKEIPVRWMRRHGWIGKARAAGDLVRECLQFFGVASVAAWREEYEKPIAAFRTSTKLSSNPGAVAAWLRKAEMGARSLRCAPYDGARFRSALTEIRALTRERDATKWVEAIQAACCAAGVAVVCAPAPTGCRASGVTRWLSPDLAMLSLSLRHKTEDHFWFTFFHEAGHVLKHSKKQVFVEDKRGGELEAEADAFAAGWLIPQQNEGELRHLHTKAQVEAFADKIGVSAGMIVGRLQHDGVVPWATPLNDLRRKLSWPRTED